VSEVMKVDVWRRAGGRRNFIGGSDARIIMGDDEAALIRLWREKRGEDPRTCQAISWFSSDLLLRISIAAGMKPIPGR